MMIRVKNSFIIYVFLLTTLSYSSLQISNNNYKKFTIKDGLPNNFINTVIQDKKGFLWIGSQGGLTKFDGKSFYTYNVSNTKEISVNDLNELYEDNKGRIWYSTFNEIGYCQKDKFHYVTSSKENNSYLIFFKEDKAKNIIIGYLNRPSIFKSDKIIQLPQLYEKGLYFYDFFPMQNSINNFFCTSKGLILVDNQYKVMQKIKTKFSCYQIIKWDNNYLVSSDNGIYQLMENQGNWSITKIEKFGNQKVVRLLVDKNNNLWGGNSENVFSIKKTLVSDFTIDSVAIEGAKGIKLQTFINDKENNIWIPSINGLIKLNESIFKKVKFYNNKEVTSFYKDKNDNSIVGTYKYGVYIYNRNDYNNLLKKKSIMSVFIDSKKNYWFSTRKNLYKYSFKKMELLVDSKNKPISNVFAINEDKKGNVWFKVGDSLGYYRNSKIEIVPKTNIFNKTKLIRTIINGNDGRIWIGTNRGVFYFKDKKLLTINDKTNFNKPYIYSLYEDKENNLWIGTDEGLFKYSDNKFMKFSIKDGLIDNEIANINEDKQGNIWLGNTGVCIINKKELANYWNSKTDKLKIFYFDESDGLPTSVMSTGYQFSALKDKDGFIWYCTLKGLARINPYNIVINTITPTPVIGSVSIDDVRKDRDNPISVLPQDKRIEFEYTAPSFVKNNAIRFKTRLVGFETMWKLRSERKISYTNLPPGDYIFKVMASNSNMVWSKKIAKLKFTVVRPVYMTWWFYLICIVLAFILMNLLLKFIRFLIKSAIFMQKSKFVGPYKIVKVIGVGGMGTVYKAISLESKNIVALKVLNESITDEEMKKRFIQEGIICEQIKHPNIIKIFGRGEDKDRLYYAMEYCDGQTLREILSNGRLSLLKCLWVVSLLLDILNEIHEFGIVHRDIKPENIMLTNRFDLSQSKVNNKLLPNLKNSLKLLDFGLAKVVGNTALTRTGLLAGTVYYLPPESIQGKKEWYPAADFYSVGILLYEMLTGLSPFDGDDIMEVMYKILESVPLSPEKIDSKIPKDVAQFTNNLLIKDTFLRLSEYKEIRKQLDELINKVVKNIY